MLRRTCWLVVLVFAATAASGQQNIYWKKDHIYSGPGGKEIAVVTPVPADQTAPSGPSGLGSSGVTATSVQLNWTASTDSGGSGLAGYKVYRQIGTGANLPVGTVGAGTLSFTDPHLQPGTGYTFTIVAFDNAQNHSASSNAITLTTPAAAADTAAPTIPANLLAWLSARSSVNLAWSASTDAGGTAVAGYRVYRGGTLISGAGLVTSPSYQDSNLSYRTGYSYTVVAVDNAGNASSASASTSITTDWELVFQDDFNRVDDNSNLGTGWNSSYCFWRVVSTKAYVTWHQRANCHHSSQSDFRATIDLVSSSGLESGISFWHGSPPWGGGCDCPAYRVAVAGAYVYLRYYPSAQLNEPGMVPLAYTDGVGSVGSLRVVAASATRNIKVYWNNVLKIDYTDTDTSRPNSGYVGFTARLPSYPPGANVYMDNFVLEK